MLPLNVLPAWHGFGIAIVMSLALLAFAILLGVALWIGAYRQERREAAAGRIPGYSLWSLWTSTNTFVFPLAYVVEIFLPLSLDIGQMHPVALSAVSGSLIGLAQWFSLRRRLRISISWVPGTMAGFVLAAALGSTFGLVGNQDWVLIGAAVGLAQCLILRSRPRAAYWILVNAAAFAAASFILPNCSGG